MCVNKIEVLTTKACEQCYWFNDCPENYLCPAGEILHTIIEMQEDGELKILIRKDILESGE